MTIVPVEGRHPIILETVQSQGRREKKESKRKRMREVAKASERETPEGK